MNGERFQAHVVTKGTFPAQNSSDNGERVRSLLCGREALAKPPGAAEIVKGIGFNEEWDHGPKRVSGRA